ncbi:DNA alkylation repair protein [Paracoccus sp. R86501]|uniref:DNA alkylation repair protein n=1 Tax=Paracoccus sp. R86501 TaxID=3101711 RepID=UPI0036721A63
MQELDQLRALANPELAERIAARHKTGRPTLGLTPAQIETAVTGWRDDLDVDGRVALARDLWDSNIHEARLAAARLLVQARIRPDDAVWDLICEWAPQLDAPEVTDAVMVAGSKRLVADPARMEEMLDWAQSSNPFQRRAVLMGTLPWAKMNNPKPADLEIRERVLEWAAHLADDSNGAVRQAIETWLRDLAKRAPERVAEWRKDREQVVAAARQDEAERAAETAARAEPAEADPVSDTEDDQDL